MRHLFEKKKPEQQMDMKTMKQMLDNVLDVCNYEHSTVPLEVLASYSKYRKERYLVQRSVMITMLLLFMLLPVLFLAPTLSLTRAKEESDSRLLLSVDSLVPLRSVSAMLDGQNIPVYQAGARSFVVQPAANGQLVVSVTAINQQETQITYDVATIDQKAPSYTASELSGDNLLLYFEDSESGLDPESIRATASDDITEVEVHWDEEKQCVEMAYPEELVNLYIADRSGNTLHLLLTPQ